MRIFYIVSIIILVLLIPISLYIVMNTHINGFGESPDNTITTNTANIDGDTNTTSTDTSNTSISSKDSSIEVIGSFKELPSTWGMIELSIVNGSETIKVKPGSIIKILLKITYMAKPKAPKYADIILGNSTGGKSFS